MPWTEPDSEVVDVLDIKTSLECATVLLNKARPTV